MVSFGSQLLQNCFHLICSCDCVVRMLDAGEYQKWIGRTLCVCVLLMLEIMSTFFSLSFTFLAIDVITLAFDVVLVHCTILSSVWIWCSCLWHVLYQLQLTITWIVIESTRATRRAFGFRANHIYTNGDRNLRWRHIFMDIHSMRHLKLWFHSSMLSFAWMRFTIDEDIWLYYVYVRLYFLTWNIFPTQEMSAKNLTMHFSWTLNGFHDFETKLRKKKMRKKMNRVEKHIIL